MLGFTSGNPDQVMSSSSSSSVADPIPIPSSSPSSASSSGVGGEGGGDVIAVGSGGSPKFGGLLLMAKEKGRETINCMFINVLFTLRALFESH